MQRACLLPTVIGLVLCVRVWACSATDRAPEVRFQRRRPHSAGGRTAPTIKETCSRQHGDPKQYKTLNNATGHPCGLVSVGDRTRPGRKPKKSIIKRNRQRIKRFVFLDPVTTRKLGRNDPTVCCYAGHLRIVHGSWASPYGSQQRNSRLCKHRPFPQPSLHFVSR